MEDDSLHTALAKAQGEMPNAELDCINPHFKSRYASLPSLRAAYTPALTKYGLSLNWRMTVRDDGFLLLIGVLSYGKTGECCIAEYLVTGTSSQARGSDITYGRRYTACCLTGIVGDDDDDANAAQKEQTMNPSQARKSGDYPPMEVALRSAKTLEELQLRWKEAQPMIRKWPASWRELIEEEKDRRKLQLADELTENDVKTDSAFKRQARESLARLDDDDPEAA